MIDRLSECYKQDLIETTKIIHSGAGKKAQVFADAFKLKKDS